MGLVDDVKELFGHHAEQLQTRMHGIEKRLSGIERSSDYQARQTDSELLIQKHTITASLAKPAELFVIPGGSFYRLTHWTCIGTESTALFLGDGQTLFDIAEKVNEGLGVSHPVHLIAPENQMLLAAPLTKEEKQVTIWLQFQVFEKQAKFQTDVVASE